MISTPNNAPTALMQLSAVELVDELLRQGKTVEELCRQVGVDTLGETLHRLHPAP